MALPSTRVQIDLSLHHIDRGVELERTLIVARHPSETAEHLALRGLAFCLLADERMEFGPGLSDPDAADLLTKDLTGRLQTWVECGAAALDKVLKMARQGGGADVHVVFGNTRRREELRSAIAEAKGSKGLERVTLWLIDPPLVAALASDDRRLKWAVTLVGEHLYVEAGGESVDGPVEMEKATALA